MGAHGPGQGWGEGGGRYTNWGDKKDRIGETRGVRIGRTWRVRIGMTRGDDTNDTIDTIDTIDTTDTIDTIDTTDTIDIRGLIDEICPRTQENTKKK